MVIFCIIFSNLQILLTVDLLHLEGGEIMKATGVIRRLDDLGRIVIPKEIRRTFRIREGDPMEIFTNRNGEIILKKYSPIGDLGNFAVQYAEALSENTGHTVCIFDRDQIIAVAGSNRKELLNQPISGELEEAIENRSVLVMEWRNGENLGMQGTGSEYQKQVIAPIVCQGDAIGAVVLLVKTGSKDDSEMDKKLASTAADFLGKQMEV